MNSPHCSPKKWSVTGFDGELLTDSQQTKMALIQGAITLHRQKGTLLAIRNVLRHLGFGEVEIDEGLKNRRYEHSHVAAIPANERWAHYAVRLQAPITNEQAAHLRKVLNNFAPARCTLAVLDYKGVPIRYNNKATYNGSYNHGSS